MNEKIKLSEMPRAIPPIPGYDGVNVSVRQRVDIDKTELVVSFTYYAVVSLDNNALYNAEHPIDTLMQAVPRAMQCLKDGIKEKIEQWDCK